MFSVGDLVAVQTTSRPEFDSRVWKVEDFTPGPPRRVILSSADGLLGDDGNAKRISCRVECCTYLAVVPTATQTPEQSSTDQWQLARLAVPTTFDDQFEMMARFVFGNRGAGSSGPLLDTWIRLPLLGGNMIKLAVNRDPDYELVLYPQLRGYQLHFSSSWAQTIVLLDDCDILKACPACQVWPWCSYCHRFLFPPEAHRSSKKHAKCIGWCRHSVEHTRVMVTARLPPVGF